MAVAVKETNPTIYQVNENDNLVYCFPLSDWDGKGPAGQYCSLFQRIQEETCHQYWRRFGPEEELENGELRDALCRLIDPFKLPPGTDGEIYVFGTNIGEHELTSFSPNGNSNNALQPAMDMAMALRVTWPSEGKGADVLECMGEIELDEDQTFPPNPLEISRVVVSQVDKLNRGLLSIAAAIEDRHPERNRVAVLPHPDVTRLTLILDKKLGFELRVLGTRIHENAEKLRELAPGYWRDDKSPKLYEVIFPQGLPVLEELVEQSS